MTRNNLIIKPRKDGSYIVLLNGSKFPIRNVSIDFTTRPAVIQISAFLKECTMKVNGVIKVNYQEKNPEK